MRIEASIKKIILPPRRYKMSKLLNVVTACALFSAFAVAQAAPTIPHPIDNYKITEGNNPCRMCHQLATTNPGQKTQIPLSHQKDGQLDPMRFTCTNCHSTAK